MQHQDSILPKKDDDRFLSIALRDCHAMPDLRPQKTMSQKNEERQLLREDEEAYINAGGIVDYRKITGEPDDNHDGKRDE